MANPLLTMAARSLERWLPQWTARALLGSSFFAGRWRKADCHWARRLRKICVRRIAPHIEKELTIALSDNIRMKVNPYRDHVIARRILIDGGYELGLIDAMKSLLDEGGVFVDVGANIGCIALWAADLVGHSGRVLAIEPNPEIATILKRNIDLNSFSNIDVAEVAVGLPEGRGTLFYSPTNPGLGRLLSGDMPNSINLVVDAARKTSTVSMEISTLGQSTAQSFEEAEARFVEVPTTSLSTLVASHGLERIDLIKIDVEGFELEVLKSGREILEKAVPPIVIAEYSSLAVFEGGDKENLLQYFLTAGWKSYVLEKRDDTGSRMKEIEKTEDGPYHDNLFFVPSAHQSRFESSFIIGK